MIRVYSDVTISKVVTGPAAGLVPDDRAFTGTITLPVRHRRADRDHLVGDHRDPGAARRRARRVGVHRDRGPARVRAASPSPATRRTSGWTPIIGEPVTVGAAERTAAVSIVVTNPTDRLFGTFDVTKVVTGAAGGIVDPAAPYRHGLRVHDRVGRADHGPRSTCRPRDTRGVGPELEIPTGSTCTLTEPLAGMPALVDDVVELGRPDASSSTACPVDAVGRQLTFVLPTPQEDDQEPHRRDHRDQPAAARTSRS